MIRFLMSPATACRTSAARSERQEARAPIRATHSSTSIFRTIRISTRCLPVGATRCSATSSKAWTWSVVLAPYQRGRVGPQQPDPQQKPFANKKKEKFKPPPPPHPPPPPPATTPPPAAPAA